MEQELTVDERDALLRVAEVVDDGKLRGDLERLAGGRGATPRRRRLHAHPQDCRSEWVGLQMPRP